MDDIEQFSNAIASMANAGAFSARNILEDDKAIKYKKFDCGKCPYCDFDMMDCFGTLSDDVVRCFDYNHNKVWMICPKCKKSSYMEDESISEHWCEGMLAGIFRDRIIWPLKPDISEETITETLYVNDKPFETVSRKSSLEDIGVLLYSGAISQADARHWCFQTGHQLSDIDQKMEALMDEDSLNKKKPWPYRLVDFLNKIVDMFVNAFLEDFI